MRRTKSGNGLIKESKRTGEAQISPVEPCCGWLPFKKQETKINLTQSAKEEMKEVQVKEQLNDARTSQKQMYGAFSLLGHHQMIIHFPY